MKPPLPDSDAFVRRHGEGLPFVVRSRVPGDLITAVAAFLKLRASWSGPAFLLESVEGGAARGRYSMIGLSPDLVWRCREGVAEIARDVTAADAPDFMPLDQPPLASLRALIAESAIDLDPDLPPMSAGLFGYLGYDMIRHAERLGPRKADPIGVPEAILVRPTLIVVFDNVRDEMSVVQAVRPRGGTSAALLAFEQVVDTLDRLVSVLEAALPLQDEPDDREIPSGRPQPCMRPDDYATIVARAKEYILAGDVFQVVLSQRFEADFAIPPFALYRSLTIRPIAGTRRRGATPAEDGELAAELLADPKERAEHLMLLDLGRNDVGRVAEIGSVEVTGSFFVERYSHVMHMVSNVEGVLRGDRDPLDALFAGFPAGTVSGAPKVRAMEIIDELEPDGRGPYGGCIGYFGADGQMDTCIVLRTAVVKDGRMYVQAGAGIVHDSDPAAEQQECVNKARAMFDAAEDAGRFAVSQHRKR